MSNDISPLQWPTYYTNPTNLTKVFIGFPIIGPDKRVFRFFRKVAADRPPIGWTYTNPQKEKVRNQLTMLLSTYLDWPSDKIHPKDPLSILLFWPFMDLTNASCILEIQETFGIEISENIISNCTIEEFIAMIISQR